MEIENNNRKINLTTIKNIENYIKMTSTSEANGTVEQKITFSGYTDLMVNVNALLQGINILSMDSTTDDRTNLDVIYTLSYLAMKIIPFNEMEFLDDLLRNKTETKNNDFISVDNLKKII